MWCLPQWGGRKQLHVRISKKCVLLFYKYFKLISVILESTFTTSHVKDFLNLAQVQVLKSSSPKHVQLNMEEQEGNPFLVYAVFLMLF